MSGPLTREDWQAMARTLGVRSQAFIDGRFVDAVTGGTFECGSPVDGRTLTCVAACEAADADRAVTAARRAFEDGRWRNLDPARRKAVLLRLAELIERDAAELALTETLDVGKPIGDASAVDIPNTVTTFRYYAEAIDKLYDDVAPTGPDVHATITREPLGVVACVVPWNFPLMIAGWKVAPALATGNSVVVKPAEQSPLSALRLAELAVEAGVPDGVLNVLPGYGETVGQALGRHGDVDAVAFTGSAEVGKLFLTYAGQSNMKQVSLECGGKSPHIVMADAGDLDAIAEQVAWGIFFNQGEVCNAGSRLLVEASVHDTLLDRVLAVARGIEVGDPLDPRTRLGAMVDETQLEQVLGYIEAGREEGAELVLGGGRARPDSGGYYVEPTVFDGVDNRMRVAQEEIFGPVLSTITFEDAEDAVRIGNDTIYGLAAALWTRNIDKALRVGKALRAGNVWINCWDGGNITTPFGGYKQSGFSRDKSIYALEKYTQLKTTWIRIR